MKVVFDHQIFSLQRNGGISRYFVELANELEKLGVDVKIRVRWSENEYLSAKLQLPKFFPWRVRQLSYYLFNYLEDLFFPPAKFDILHNSYFGNSPLLKRATKHVITVFDMIHESNLVSYSKIDSTVKSKKNLLFSADAVIAISHATKQEILNIYPSLTPPIHVVYLGSSLQRTSSEPSVKLSHLPPFLLYVGNRQGYKNFLSTLKAIAPVLLEEDRYVVCFGGGRLTDHEISTIESLGLTSQVHQLSGSDIELSWCYQHALALIYPSLTEGFGLPLVEAFSLGCPVLTSNCSSMKEISGDAALLFDPANQSEIYEATLNLVKDRYMRNTMISKGLVRAKMFSWSLTAKQTMMIYINILQKGS